MKKRILSLVLCLCMVAGLLPPSALAADTVASGNCGENVTWELDSGGTLTIEGTGTISDYSTNSAGDQAPWKENRYNIERIVIKYGVTQIGKGAFAGGYLKLNSVSIPSSVESIGIRAFADCTNLTSVTIPEGVKVIGDYAFLNCENLRSVLVPSSVTEMGSEIFSGMHKDGKLYFNGDFPDVGQSPIPDYVTVYYVQGTSWWDTVPAANLTLVPWSGGMEVPITGQTYELSYILSGGTGDFPTIELFPGVSVWAPSGIPTRNGCKFWGWYDVDDAENDVDNLIFANIYEPGKINNSFIMPERNVVLKAIWVDPVTGTFVPDTGVEEPVEFPDGFWLDQPDGVRCTLTSAAMMLRHRSFLDGRDWETITVESLEEVAWASGGLKLGSYVDGEAEAFVYNGMHVMAYGSTVRDHNTNYETKKAYFKDELSKHPEGIVIYDNAKATMHAVLLTRYDESTDTFYCVDPARNRAKAEIELQDSMIAGNSQHEKVMTIDQTWFIYLVDVQKQLASTTASTHCPVEMQITVNGMTLDSTNVNGTVTNSYITMTATGTGLERSVTATMMENITQGNNIDVKLLGTDTGYMTFTAEYLYTDGTTETHIYKNVPVTQTTIGTAGGFFPQTTLLLTLSDTGNEENSVVWATNPNETAVGPSTDFGDVADTPDEPSVPDIPDIPTVPDTPDCSYTPSTPTPTTYSITAPIPAHGTVILSTQNAAKGATVTVTVTPEDGYELASLTVTNSKGAELELTDMGSDKYAFTMPGGKVSVDVVFQAVQAPSDPPAQPWANPYADVAPSAWYYDAVAFVSENGLMTGANSTTFAPDTKLSRAMLAQILYNREGRPAASGSAFSDVPAGAWYADAVAWAVEKGVVGGYGNGLFGPEDDITREQLAVMLWRYAGSPAPAGGGLTFRDADKASSYALDALRWAVERGVLNGKAGNVLDPQGPATRGEAAQMLKNYLE